MSQDMMSNDPIHAHDPAMVKAANTAKLAHMARQIGDFFKTFPEEQAVPAIADHINLFWSRRMREDFLRAYNAESPDLSPLVRKAMARIRPGGSRPSDAGPEQHQPPATGLPPHG